MVNIYLLNKKNYAAKQLQTIIKIVVKCAKKLGEYIRLGPAMILKCFLYDTYTIPYNYPADQLIVFISSIYCPT